MALSKPKPGKDNGSFSDPYFEVINIAKQNIKSELGSEECCDKFTIESALKSET
jgi:hypothetical protein